MAKLVVFGAVASACLAPALRLADAGAASWPDLLLAEAVAIQLALALTAMVLVRRGPHRDWIILALLTPSVVVVFGVIVVLLADLVRNALALMAWGQAPTMVPLIVVGSLAALGIGPALIVLLRRVLPRVCPYCRRPLLLRERDLGVGSGRTSTYRCAGCGNGSRYWRAHRSWEALPGPR
jgi:hypothetical protein